MILSNFGTFNCLFLFSLSFHYCALLVECLFLNYLFTRLQLVTVLLGSHIKPLDALNSLGQKSVLAYSRYLYKFDNHSRTALRPVRQDQVRACDSLF